MTRRRLLLGINEVLCVPNNQIWYKTQSGNTIAPYTTPSNLVSNTYENGIGVMTFSATITATPASLFRNRTDVIQVLLPDSITEIGNYFCYGCTSLTNITIPKNTTTINQYAFRGCTGFTQIIIPNSVTAVNLTAFGYCSNVTSVTIGSGVKSFGSNTFTQCTSLTHILCKAVTPPTITTTSVFNKVPTSCKLYVPEESLSTYQNNQYWGVFTDIFGI